MILHREEKGNHALGEMYRVVLKIFFPFQELFLLDLRHFQLKDQAENLCLKWIGLILAMRSFLKYLLSVTK